MTAPKIEAEYFLKMKNIILIKNIPATQMKVGIINNFQ